MSLEMDTKNSTLLESVVKHMILKEIDLYITEKCNLSCPFCSIRATANSTKELDFNIIKQFVDFCKENEVTDIHITGGEPTLHKNYKDIIKYIIDTGIDTRLITNGLLLSENDLIELKEIGLKKLMFSLDGTESFHESVRGKGTFKKTFSTVKNAIATGFNVRVNAVAWEENTDSILELMCILDEISADVFSVFLGSPVGRAKDQNRLTVIGAEDWISFIKKLRYIYSQYNLKIKVVIEQGFISAQECIEHVNLRSCTSIINNTDYLSVRADGNVFPCVFFSNDFQSIGNIYNIYSYDFYGNLKKSKLYNLIATLPSACSSCNNVEHCYGGCRGFNFSPAEIGRDLRCRQDRYIPICPLIKRDLFEDDLAPCTDDLLL